MKVLIITEGYFPGNNYGGPPVSINNLCRLLKDKADFFIITKDHDFKDRKRYDNITDGWNKSPEASVLYCNDSKYNYNTFVDSIVKIVPDFIYLQTLVSGKLLLRIRKYLINNIFRGQTPVHDLKCLHLQSVS